MRTKPQSPGTPIRWSHPLAVGLRRAWNFNGTRGRDSAGWTFRDSVAGDVVTYTRSDADTKWSTGPAGPAFQAGASGATPWQNTATLGTLGLTKSVTVIGRYQKFGANPNNEQVPVLVTGSYLCKTRSGSGANDGFSLGSNAADVFFVVDGFAKFLGAKYATTISSGPWYTLGGTYHWDPSVATYGGTWSLYLDGIRRGQNNYVGAGTYSATFADNVIQFGQDGSCSDRRVDYEYFWNRALSPQEVAWVTDAPFEIYAQPRAWSFGATVAAASGNGLLLKRRRLLAC